VEKGRGREPETMEPPVTTGSMEPGTVATTEPGTVATMERAMTE